jgi:hypothetical protein
MTNLNNQRKFWNKRIRLNQIVLPIQKRCHLVTSTISWNSTGTYTSLHIKRGAVYDCVVGKDPTVHERTADKRLTVDDLGPMRTSRHFLSDETSTGIVTEVGWTANSFSARITRTTRILKTCELLSAHALWVSLQIHSPIQCESILTKWIEWSKRKGKLQWVVS